MRLHQLKGLVLISVILMASGCTYVNTQKPSSETPVYIYSFQKTPSINIGDSKHMVTELLGISKVHDLTLNKDENIAYFVADDNVNSTFEQNLTNGNFAFSKLPSSYMGKSSPKLPGIKDAQKIAEDFISSKNFTPKTKSELRLVHTGGVRAQAVGGPIVNKLITFTFGREIDQLPVIGPGSKIIVNVGDKGEVVGMTRRWRELNLEGRKELKPQELITEKEAKAEAEKRIKKEFGRNVNFEITRSTKSYYDGNGNVLQPVWAFEAKLNLNPEDKNLQPIKYLSIISMLKNSPEPIQLQTLDPRAKSQIKTVQPLKDTTGTNIRGTLPRD